MAGLKERAKTLVELADLAAFYVRPRPLAIDAKAEKALDDEGRTILAALIDKLDDFSPWTRDSLENLARVMSEERGVKLGKVAQPIRAALTGSTVSPPIFEVMEILGPDETLGRLRDAQSHS